MHLNLWDAGAAMQFLVTITEATGFKSTGIKPCSQQTNWTELTCTKLTQLHDALLVTRVTKLIGCRAAACSARSAPRTAV